MSTRVKVVVVGSGPAGCYFAEGLAKRCPEAEITVLDRLPTPFGLLRYGVAADHQGTKATARVLARPFAAGKLAFRGGVEVGQDVTLAELAELYDAVVLATGAPEDRRLAIPGEELPGVYGSAAFVGWLNGHPERQRLGAEVLPRLARARSLVVIGNGNVALDVARVFAKSGAELARSDLAPVVIRAIAAAPLSTIHVVGRRGLAEARFSPAELAEFTTLERAEPLVDPADLARDGGDDEVRRLFTGFPARPSGEKAIAVRFHFGLAPTAFLGDGELSAVAFEGTGYGGMAERSPVELAAELAVTAIGYRAVPCCTLAPDRGVFAHEEGRIRPGLYVTGWAARGPSGTIATNRPEGHGLAARLAGELTAGGREGLAGLDRLLAARDCRALDFAGWQAIERAETARAAEGRPREKFTSLAALQAAAAQLEAAEER